MHTKSTPLWSAGSVALLTLLVAALNTHGQGCVIARGGGGAMIIGGDGFLDPGQFQTSLSYRWLHSDRHFVGTEEQTHRQDEGTEVVNNSHFFDLTATYAVSRRFWLNLTVPFVHSTRSSLYEHLGNSSGQRFETSAGGLGDVRLTGTYWLFDPDAGYKGNFALGLGVKAPTGEYKATDVFMRPGGPEIRYVDSSIQPGDGGWGVVLEGQGFVQIYGPLSGYLNLSYLMNPREEVESTGFSVPDTYLGRAGVDYAILPSHGVSVTLGGRLEGVPYEDLVGGSEGRRRPGYVISVEPGVSISRGNFFASVTAPIAVVRNRVKSVSDYRNNRHGDAAFADYTINATVAWRF